MINYILIILGSVFALTGIILFIKKIGNSASKVKFLGAELETGSSSLVIFVVGAALIAFGATINKKVESTEPGNASNTSLVKGKTDSPKNGIDTLQTGKDSEQHIANTADTSHHTTLQDQPLYYFTLTADQQHVINELQITLTLSSQVPLNVANSQEKAIKIRIWRNITHPLSDTAVLDHSVSGDGVEIQVFVLGASTPVSITDVGQYHFYVYNPVMIGHRIVSVQVKMYKN